MLSGESLIIALRRTQSNVKVVCGQTAEDKTPADVERMVSSAADCWEGFGSARRVRGVRKVARAATWQKCWRTSEASVLGVTP